MFYTNNLHTCMTKDILTVEIKIIEKNTVISVYLHTVNDILISRVNN